MKLLVFFTSLFWFGCTHTTTNSSTQSGPGSANEARAARVEFAEQKIVVDAYWKEKPVVDKELKLRLEVRNEKEDLVPPPGDLSVSVWMKTHSYGLVEPSVQPVMDDKGVPVTGVFNVSNIMFMAPGQWEVRVYLNQSGQQKSMQRFVADLGAEKPNPMNDPNSPIHQMMNKNGTMDHSKHMNHGNHGDAKHDDSGAKSK